MTPPTNPSTPRMRGNGASALMPRTQRGTMPTVAQAAAQMKPIPSVPRMRRSHFGMITARSCGSGASVNQLPQLRTDRGNTQHVDLARSVVREGGRDDDGLSLFLAAREREIARSPRGSIVRVVVV